LDWISYSNQFLIIFGYRIKPGKCSAGASRFNQSTYQQTLVHFLNLTNVRHSKCPTAHHFRCPKALGADPGDQRLYGLQRPTRKSYPQRRGVIHKKSMKTLLLDGLHNPRQIAS
jgi:hypothetical protein